MVENIEELLEDVTCAQQEGEKAAWAAIVGEEPDLAALERWASAMELLHKRIANGTMCSGWTRPTEADIDAAKRLVKLVREGVPRKALIEPAWQVYRVTADPDALYGLCSVLPWLAGETQSIGYRNDAPADLVIEWLDKAIHFFERGGNVAGFSPTPEDLSRVRRLRELVTPSGSDALAERYRLAAELRARLPQDEVSKGLRSILVVEES
jgi:hypothetical protein